MPDYQNCTDVINQILLNPNRGDAVSDILGFMVHDSIFEHFCAHLSRHRVTIDTNLIWDYTLYVDNELFMMKLIHIAVTSADQREYFNTLVEHAKVSFYWEEAITLYTTKEHYHYLKNFIAENNLTKSIRRKYTTQSISYHPTELIVVEFFENVTSEIIQKFYTKHKSLPDCMYYVTHALDYLAPKNLEHFDKPYTNPNTLLILYLVLDYHRSRKLKEIDEVFNIIDLCAMKLAFDDPRYEYENCEFEKLIKSLLINQKYIKSDVFNMKLYLINNAVHKLPEPSIITYFMCNYQSYFNHIEYFENFDGQDHQQNNILKLNEIMNPVNLIKFLEHNKMIKFDSIDGTNFTRWSAALFINLYERGARRITIDTTFACWDECGEVEQNFGFFSNNYVNSLEFNGTNHLHFIENFVNWMKLNLGDGTKYFNIQFAGCQILHPFIFNRLTIGNIQLNGLTITKHLLDNIERCHYNKISMLCCKLENNVSVIESLDSIDKIDLIILQMEDHTIELFMRFVADYMSVHDLREFEFRNKFCIIGTTLLNFEKYKFVLNQDRTRLELYHKPTGEVVDLFLFMMDDIEGEELSVFYQ